MKQKLILGGAVLLLLVVILLMIHDMFQKQSQNQSNPFEYKLDNFEHIDSSMFCYHEVKRFNPIIQKLNGIAIDNEDNLYLTGLQKVMIYDKNLEFQKGFKTSAEAKNIAVSNKGEIFLGVSDHVEIWDKTGNHIKSWNRYNNKTLITSLAVSEDAVYLADAGNKLVLKYDFEGKLLQEIGRKDTLTDRPGFIIPSPFFDVAIGRQDELWAVNSGMHTFENYNHKGKLASSWNRTSMQIDGFSGCCNPSHMAILSDGSFVTSEKGLVRVKIHNPSGDFKCVVAGPESFEKGTKGIDLAVNSNDEIFLIVPNKKEVRIYKKNEN